MDPATLRTLAETLAGVGALLVAGVGANMLVLRGLGPHDVPTCVRARVCWWSANSLAVLGVSVALTLLGLAGIAAL